MCGITGFIAPRNLDFNLELTIERMTNSLKHRGPDDYGYWVNLNPHIALGHRRLSIIDLSNAARQPMTCLNQKYIIVFNGEIYNYLELKKVLLKRGYSFKSNSDTEIILGLVSELGIKNALNSLSGMFSFAILDLQTHDLYLARDRFGEKPLYYSFSNNHFVFSSELKALKQYPFINFNIAPNSLKNYLHYGYIPSPDSIFENIKKLPPGTYIKINCSQIITSSGPEVYWSAYDTIKKSLANPIELSEHECIQLLDSKLHQTIKNRMIADVNIGSFLSGGIDSSLITAIMQANNSKAIPTFTIGFHEKSFNEAQHAKKIAQAIGTQHTEVYLNSSDALNIIPLLPSIFDEPFADSSAIPTLLVSMIAQKSVKVCLSGDGGDELFGGYNRYLLGTKIWSILKACPLPLRLVIKQLLEKFPNTSNWSKKSEKITPLLTSKSASELYQILIAQCMQPEKFLNNPLHDFIIDKRLLKLSSNSNLHQDMMATDTISYLPDDILVKIDRASMAFGLETRSPFLDHELFELAWSLPDEFKIRKNQTKWILKQVLKNYVPETLFNRPKMGFGLPLGQWLRTTLKDWGESLLDEQMINKYNLLNHSHINKMWQSHLKNEQNYQYQLWPILMLQAWLEEQEK